MRTRITGGMIYDGTGAPPYPADVLVDGGIIAAIGPEAAAGDARVLDAAGMAVTPGFVDMHRHCDLAALYAPGFGAVELAQGITTTVVGNCGLAPVPLPADPAVRADLSDLLTPVTGPIPADFACASYADYARALRKAAPPLDVRFFAGAGAIRTAVNGFCPAPLTDAQMRAAHAHVETAMEAGALGMTTGLMYPPECHATPEEMAALLRPAARWDALLCAHIRGEGDSLVPSVREIIGIAARAGLRLNISHFKATGKRNWRSLIFAAIDEIERARAAGQAVTVDFYPYDGGSTTLQSVLPPCLLDGGQAAMLRRLATPAGKAAARDAIYREHPGWDNMVTSIGWERILVSTTTLPEHAAWQGHDMASLADAEGYGDPCDLMCDLLATEAGRVGIVTLSMDMADVATIAALPYAAVISDALYSVGGNPHPRLYGAFPRALRLFVHEAGIWTLAEGIHRMTGIPAERLGLDNRGTLAIGRRADICVFDPAKLTDHATFADPKRLSTGMHAVLVGGEIKHRDQ